MDREQQFKIFTGILIAAFAIIILRLVQLQLIEGQRNLYLAEENAAKVIPILAPRGIIYDRNGKVIVSNRAVFAVYVLPSALAVDKKQRDVIINRLSEIIQIPADKISARLGKTKHQPFEPVLIKDHLALETVTKLEERRSAMEGVVVRYRPVRYYPFGKLAAHLLGYVAEIESDELASMVNRGYKLGDFIGKDGVERSYDTYLRGVDGGQKVEVDVYGKPVRVVSSSDPVPGNDIKLTIDIELQEAVEEYLEGHYGASLVLNPKTGEILAMASRPVYDPVIFTEKIEAKTWEKIDRTNHPFMNRALSIYPPGSTFKVVTLSAVLEEGLVTGQEMTDCRGYFRLGSRVARCWLEGGHGMVSVLEGLVWSCDVVFYELGLKAGADMIAKYARLYGLGRPTGIDLPGEKEGSVPTEDWKKRRYGQPWFKGDTINYAIGQGFLQLTPLQLAVCYGTVATGERYKPYVVSKVISRDGRNLFKNDPEKVADVPVSQSNLAKIKEALKQVVKRATGVAAYVPGFPAAGKTGTSENPGKAHAWFVCFAPYDDPEIVIVNFIEHGEHGDKAPARIAGKIMRWYKEHRLTKIYEEEPYGGQYIMHGDRQEPYRNRLPIRRTVPTLEARAD
ncbi:MAG: penicillin-binding protein 2 [Candidatus Margulisbacteria bacterium]|nr:penicillin-binding protein 2 [Candidatus Margulisiibacteriota bacterium]MBU1021471.1 penicillin-binding protein 2 [Candidatus Margulisiibacteriota bacterium]MBU1728392.1 penicillin-binding protein 2 [Candidatus Margulisiibacteriota bacterium]MBU1955865.1 penicillin-binding protein 2 [Candidatus Margulisiibacteriota bacterium]